MPVCAISSSPISLINSRTQSPLSIVGIILVRNEEYFVARAIRNILDFCDRVIVADNESKDDTWPILKRLAARDRRIELHRVRCVAASHDLIADFAGTRTWVFGVDGDEIYDPIGLARLRRRIERGEFDHCWQVFGNVLNCVSLEISSGKATGYLAPPCRSMTKLYNFAAIESWQGRPPERLHGGDVVFRPDYAGTDRCMLHERETWEESPFRCLHVCFLPRSRADDPGRARRNIVELGARSIFARLVDRVGLGRSRAESRYKYEKYQRGALTTVDARVFFNDGTR